MKVDFVDLMGDDLSVVNAARVSFDKVSHYADSDGSLSDRDVKLIQYLAKHKHEIPFAHTSLTFRVTAPISIRTQCFKHKVGFVENEVSRRYVTTSPEFYTPKEWRLKADNKKQGSSEELAPYSDTITNQVDSIYALAKNLYENLISQGVCPEQARFILPQGMNTTWIWTGSLLAYARFYNLRTEEHAQKEIQTLAKMIGEHCNMWFPVSWKELTK